jgi:hypothetical protein
MGYPERGSLGRRGEACIRWGELLSLDEGERLIPLVEEVPIGINDVWFWEFMLDEGDDVREVALAGVLTVDDRNHGGRKARRESELKGRGWFI